MLALLAATLMQAAAPPAAAPAGPAANITQASWLKLPSAEDLERFYPAAAAAAHLEGRAMIHCNVDVRGDLIGCQVAAEDPPGQGFGEAALSLATTFKMALKTKDGASVAGGQINIPIRFALPKVQEAPATFVTHADWTHKPTGEDMARAYPAGAARAGMEGHSTLKCIVTANGDLADCSASVEVPAGSGFGAAALRLAGLFHMKPVDRDGQPTAGRTVNIPIAFLLPRR